VPASRFKLEIKTDSPREAFKALSDANIPAAASVFFNGDGRSARPHVTAIFGAERPEIAEAHAKRSSANTAKCSQ
jgi:hypothetical protein